MKSAWCRPYRLAAARASAGGRRTLLADRRSTTALEFSILSIPFVVLMLGTMEMGYDLFLQLELDNAVATAARQVQIGDVIGGQNETSAQFVNAICNSLNGLIECPLLIVGVEPVPKGYDYSNNPSPLSLTGASGKTGAICTGEPGQLMVMQAWYTGPTFVGSFIPAFTQSWNNTLVHITTSSAGWVNEPFAGGQAQGVGCS
jgi:hypothetical protein